MSDAAEKWAQLLALRSLTKTIGALHEAQLLQLRYWPRLALPHSTACEARVDLPGKTVTFIATLGKSKPPADLVARLEGLNRSVKDLLDPEFAVIVETKDGKTIFDSGGLSDGTKPTVVVTPKPKRKKKKAKRARR